MFSQPQSYPKPPPSTWPTVKNRPLLPVYPPPGPLNYPALPSPARAADFTADYTLSTHIVPGAHLRASHRAPIPPPIPVDAPKDERRRMARALRQRLHAMQLAATPERYPMVLWNCVNRYVRRDAGEGGSSGLTLFLTHANGFPKETWEPTIRFLLSSAAQPLVDEIWAWESVQHGDACLLNAESLSGAFDWTDDARDILNFFIYFLPTAVSSAPLPTHLRRVNGEESEYRKRNGFRQRTLVVVGHSFGGCTSTLAALAYPAFFSSIILVDPIIVKPNHRNIIAGAAQLAEAALLRRDTWRSRKEAFQTLSKNPFFSTWHPDVLKLYVEYGTYETRSANGAHVVKLKMPGIHESIIFSEALTSFQVWQRLQDLESGIEVRWIVPGKTGAYEPGPPGSTQERVWLRRDNASNIRIANAGHLIPQETPEDLAFEIGRFIRRRYTRTSRL